MNANRIEPVVQTIKSLQLASMACAEMAVDTAECSKAKYEYITDAEALDRAYDAALDFIEDGDYREATASLERARRIERRGGDDAHACSAIRALRTLLSDSTAA